jgi:hypothetical protein
MTSPYPTQPHSGKSPDEDTVGAPTALRREALGHACKVVEREDRDRRTGPVSNQERVVGID